MYPLIEKLFIRRCQKILIKVNYNIMHLEDTLITNLSISQFNISCRFIAMMKFVNL